jgi:hypothetical protein
VALIFPKKKKNPKKSVVAPRRQLRIPPFALRRRERERADRKTNNGTGDDGVGNDDTAHWKLREKKKRNKKG